MPRLIVKASVALMASESVANVSSPRRRASRPQAHRRGFSRQRMVGGPMPSDNTTTRRVYELAYGRAGDKGNIANVSVIARSPVAYAELKEKLTAERVRAHL